MPSIGSKTRWSLIVAMAWTFFIATYPFEAGAVTFRNDEDALRTSGTLTGTNRPVVWDDPHPTRLKYRYGISGLKPDDLGIVMVSMAGAGESEPRSDNSDIIATMVITLALLALLFYAVNSLDFDFDGGAFSPY